MNDDPIRPLRRMCAFLAFAGLVEASACGLTVIALRQQEARVAHKTEAIEGVLQDTARKMRSVEAVLAEAKQPDLVKMRVASSLAPIKESQTIWGPHSVLPPPESAPRPAFSLKVASLEPAAGAAYSR